MPRSSLLLVLLLTGFGGCAASEYDPAQAQEDPAVDRAGQAVSPDSLDSLDRCSPSVPFTLIVKDASALLPAVRAAHAACPRNGGSWCTVDSGAAFTYPRCLTMTPTLAEMAAAAVSATDHGGVYDPRYGRALTRAELAMTSAFRTGLLSAVDAFARDTDVRATFYESEEPCHNCHQYSLKYVLIYPRTRTIVVVDGTHGYDS